MAQVVYSTGIQAFRGSIGGATFAWSKAGYTARQRRAPITSRQQNNSTQRASFSVLRYRWTNTLTNSDRAAWIAQAALEPLTDPFGNTYYIHGLNWYIRSLSLLAFAGASFITLPPAALQEGPYTVTIAGNNTTGIQVTDWGGISNSPAGNAIYWYAGPYRQTPGFHSGPWSHLTVVPTTSWTTPFTLIPAGSVTNNRTYYFRGTIIRNNGCSCLPIFASCYTTP